MSKIFKNMLPYWKGLIIVVALLVVQAWCDLSLPAYTSDIIDVGIQNKGVEHVLPEAVTEDEFTLAQLFMADEEKESWENSYEKDGDVYRLTVTDKKQLDELDDTLLLPLLMNYQMSSVDEQTFKESVAKQTGMDQAMLDNMSIEQIGESMGVPLTSFEKEVEDDDGNTVVTNCVDMRTIFAAMEASGAMTEEQILSMRDTVSDTIDTMGSSLVKSMGIAYAVSCDTAAGVDIDKVQTSYLWSAGGRMVAMALLMGVATVLVGFFGARIGAGIGRDLRGKIFGQVVRFSNAEMDHFSTASLITRSTNDIQQIQMVSAVMIRMVAYAPILGIGGVLKIIQTGAGMGWIIILAILVILGYVMVLMSVTMPRFKLMQKLVDKINLVSREILTGLSVIRAFGRETEEEKRFDAANKDLTKTMLFTNRVMTFMMPGMMLIMNLLTVGIVWVGAHKIDAGSMQVGSMTAFITYAMMIVMAFLMLTAMSIMLPRAAVAAERIDEVIRTESSIEDAKNPEELREHKGVIRFSHVSFRYPGAEADVLEDIDFTAEPGKTTAIIGSTGCGKTTLLNLIPRFYDATKGSVQIEGKDVREYSLEELRGKIGMVLQKAVLFKGTIRENMLWGNENATDEDIMQALEVAQAKEFVDKKEGGLDFEIEQGGKNLSGGQRQRMTIARAVVKKPDILILDDSASALDFATDAKLRMAIRDMENKATVFIVSQRAASIMYADKIIVLDDGQIVGMGTHEELLKQCEVYQEIYYSQFKKTEDEKEGR